LAPRKKIINGTPNGKIGFFVSSFNAGGVQRVTINLANELVKHGYIVDIVAAANQGPLTKSLDSAVGIKILNSKRVLFAIKQLIKYFNAERPSVFISGQTHLNVIAIIARKLSSIRFKLIVVEHNHMSSVVKRRETLINQLRPMWAKLFYRFSSQIVAVSKEVATDLAKVSGIDRDAIKVIYNPVIDRRIFELHDIPVKHPWFQNSDSPIVLGVGRLTAQKEFSNLILAIAKVNAIKPIRLLILGEGEQREKLEAIVNNDKFISLIPYSHVRIYSTF